MIGASHAGAWGLALALALGTAPTASATPLEASRRATSVTPTRIAAGLFFDGGTLFVHGAIDDGSQVAVRVTAPAETRRFGLRGRIGGIVWGGVGHVSFRNAPSLYALYASAPLEALAGPALRAQLRLGYDAFAPGIVVEGSPTGAGGALVAELIRLKEREGLYRVAPGAIDVADAAGGARAFRVTIPVPASAPAGELEVAVLELREGALVRAELAPVRLAHVGIPAALGALARENGPAFGFLAVLVLLLTGLGVDVLRGGIGALADRAARSARERGGGERDAGGKATGT